MNKPSTPILSRRNTASILLFVSDWMLLFIATGIDDHINQGNFFSDMNTWRWGMLGMPVVIVGIVLGALGLKQAKGIKKIPPFAGVVLCLLTVSYLVWVIVNAHNAKYWGV